MSDIIKTNLSNFEKDALKRWVGSTKLIFSHHAKQKMAERGITIDDVTRLQVAGDIHRLEYRYRETKSKMCLGVFVSDNDVCLVIDIPSGVVTTVLNVYNKEIKKPSDFDFSYILKTMGVSL